MRLMFFHVERKIKFRKYLWKYYVQLICTKVRMTIQLTNHGNLMVTAVINTPISSSSPASVLSIIENASSFSWCQPSQDQIRRIRWEWPSSFVPLRVSLLSDSHGLANRDTGFWLSVSNAEHRGASEHWTQHPEQKRHCSLNEWNLGDPHGIMGRRFRD